MKKVALTLALATVCEASANAQDSVVLYGVVDAGIASTHVSGPDGLGRSATGAVSGGLTDSLFGLKGQETLSEGWFANFQLESMFDGVTGASYKPARVFDSQAWVGVGSEAAGQWRFGRQPTAAKRFGEQLEVSSWKEMGLGATFKASDNYQIDQAVSYVSPQWAGLTFGASYSFDVASRGHANGKSPSASLAARFVHGSWTLIATWDKTRLSDDVLANAPHPQAWQLGVIYEAGFAKVSLGWSRQKNGYVDLDSGDPDSAGLGLGAQEFVNGGRLDAYVAGISVPVGNGEWQLQWSYVKPDWHWQDGEKARSGQLATLGYVYSLSPRSKLYAMAGVASRYSLSDQLRQGQGTTTRYMAGILHSF